MAKIFTHGGQAHRDDFIACCLLIASNSDITEIVRVPHSEFSFQAVKPGDFVVDIGMEYDFKKQRFDHHQLSPKFGESRSAFAMVFEDCLGGEAEKASVIFDWYQLSSDLDCHGPKAMADSLGISSNKLHSLMSPVEAQLLIIFENDPASILELMRTLGKGWLSYYDNYANAMTSHEGYTTFSTMGVKVLDMLHVGRGKLHTAITTKLGLATGANVIVSLDPTGEGVQLYRMSDCPLIDFQLLSGADGVLFAHKGGFIAKTKNMDVDWRKLLDATVLATRLCNLQIAEEVESTLNMSNLELAS